jgi:hypothetical protein
MITLARMIGSPASRNVMKKILAIFNRYPYRCLAIIVLIACGVQFLIPARPGRISKANFDRIEIGMTEAEVEEILGTGGYRSSHPDRKFPGTIYIGVPGGGGYCREKYWDGGQGSIQLRFDGDKVWSKHWADDVTPWDHFRKELGLHPAK